MVVAPDATCGTTASRGKGPLPAVCEHVICTLRCVLCCNNLNLWCFIAVWLGTHRWATVVWCRVIIMVTFTILRLQVWLAMCLDRMCVRSSCRQPPPALRLAQPHRPLPPPRLPLATLPHSSSGLTLLIRTVTVQVCQTAPNCPFGWISPPPVCISSKVCPACNQWSVWTPTATQTSNSQASP